VNYPAFILDVHLGRLARLLRFLGFDAVYRNDFTDEQLIKQALGGSRIILTRDRGLLKHGGVQRGYWVRSARVNEQVREIVHRFDLAGQLRPFTRCPLCNGSVAAVPKSEVEDRLLPGTKSEFHEFTQCRACGKIYWKGSHCDRLRAALDLLRNSGRAGSEDEVLIPDESARSSDSNS